MRATSVRGTKSLPSGHRAATKSADSKKTAARQNQSLAKPKTATKQAKTNPVAKSAAKTGKAVGAKASTIKVTKTTSPVKKPAAKAVAAKPDQATPVKRATASPAAQSAAKAATRRDAKPAPTSSKSAKNSKTASATAYAALPKQPSRAESMALRVFERAHKAFSLGNFAQARDLFNELLGTFGSASEVVARARTYLNIAENRLRAAAPPPRDADALYDTGVVALNRGDLTTARDYFERALKREPDAAHIHYVLATIHARTGAPENALVALGKALQNNPKLRIRTMQDSDFATLRDLPDYEKLVEGN